MDKVNHLYNKETAFFHPKDKNGNFIQPFDYRFSGGQGARAYYDENNGKYIQSATLNGMEWNKPWLSHDDIINGGKLVLIMGDKANKNGAFYRKPHRLPQKK